MVNVEWRTDMPMTKNGAPIGGRDNLHEASEELIEQVSSEHDEADEPKSNVDLLPKNYMGLTDLILAILIGNNGPATYHYFSSHGRINAAVDVKTDENDIATDVEMVSLKIDYGHFVDDLMGVVKDTMLGERVDSLAWELGFPEEGHNDLLVEWLSSLEDLPDEISEILMSDRTAVDRIERLLTSRRLFEDIQQFFFEMSVDKQFEGAVANTVVDHAFYDWNDVCRPSIIVDNGGTIDATKPKIKNEPVVESASVVMEDGTEVELDASQIDIESMMKSNADAIEVEAETIGD